MSYPHADFVRTQPSNLGLPLVRFPWWSREISLPYPETPDAYGVPAFQADRAPADDATDSDGWTASGAPRIARDLMCTDVVSVAPDSDVGDVAKVLVRNGISAVPVVEPTGRLLGMVSEGDLIRRPEIGTERKARWWSDLIRGQAERAAEIVKEHGSKARHVMTSPAISVEESATVRDVAALFEEKKVRRLPVLREGHVVGVVSRSDLLRSLSFVLGSRPSVRPSDAELQREIMNRIAALTSDHWFVNVTVQGGMVELGGMVSSAAMQRAVTTVAESTPGVVSVNVHLSRRPSGTF